MKAVLKLRIQMFRAAVPTYCVCLCDEKILLCPWSWKCCSDQTITIVMLTVNRLYSWRADEQSSDEVDNEIRKKQTRYFNIGNTKKEKYRFEVSLPPACSFQVSSNPKSGVKDIFGLTEVILRRRQ